MRAVSEKKLLQYQQRLYACEVEQERLMRQINIKHNQLCNLYEYVKFNPSDKRLRATYRAVKRELSDLQEKLTKSKIRGSELRCKIQREMITNQNC